MYSNFLFKFFIISNLTLSLGCGIKLGEKNNQDQVVKISSADCLSKSLPLFKKYFQGVASEMEAESAFQCLQDVFVAFKENIRGAAKDSYTPEEIATFVEQNFFSNNDYFTPSFLNELMHFKVALLGGTTAVVKKTEVDQLVGFLNRMTPELVNLNRHMPIITFNWDHRQAPQNSPEKEKRFLEAKKALSQFTKKFASEFEDSNQSYDIDHLARLVKETALLINADPSVIKKIEEARPFIKSFKLLLIGGDTSLKGTEWQRLFSTLHEFLFQTLRYEYFLKELTSNDLELRWKNYQMMTLDMSNLIETLVQNRNSKVLLNAEISQLFKELAPIFKEAELDSQVLNKLGDLKVALLGESSAGSSGWSVSDLQRLQAKVPSLFSSFSRLHRLYLTLNEKDQKSFRIAPNEFSAIEKEFLIEINQIGSQFVQAYNLNSLKELIKGLVNGPLKDVVTLPKNFDELFEVGVSVKETMTGNKGSGLSLNDIRTMLDFGSRFYLHYTEYVLFTKVYDFTHIDFVASFSHVWSKALRSVDELLNRRLIKTIRTQEIVPLILKLQKSKLIDTDFNSISLRTVLNALWSNLLNDPQVRLSGRSQQGLNKVTLSRLRNETDIFLKTQRQIVALFKQSAKWDRKNLIARLTKRMQQTDDRAEQMGLSELIYLDGKSVPLIFNEKQKVLVISAGDSEKYSYYDITISNISRALSRLIITSYANDVERVRKKIGVTLEEVNVAFNQFRQIAIDSGALDPENTTFISNRFLEANLFLSVSNGDQLANFDEVHNLLIHIYSGLNRANIFKLHIKNQCHVRSVNRKSTVELIPLSCLLQVFYDEREAFSGLPGFLNLKHQYPKDEFLEYGMNLLFAAGHTGGDEVKVSDMDLIPHVIQYVEMVFATYDLNQNLALEKEEALKAFPVFQSLIKELTASYNLKDQELPGVFIYLLKYGRGPKTIPEKLAFLNFIRNPDKWSIQTSRLGVGKIFRFIAESKKDKTNSIRRSKDKASEGEKRKRKEMEDLYKG